MTGMWVREIFFCRVIPSGIIGSFEVLETRDMKD